MVSDSNDGTFCHLQLEDSHSTSKVRDAKYKFHPATTAKSYFNPSSRMMISAPFSPTTNVVLFVLAAICCAILKSTHFKP